MGSKLPDNSQLRRTSPGKYKLVYFNSSSAYGERINKMTKKYLNKSINCSTIRKIWETYFLTSKDYHKLNNEEKKALHAKMLHCTASASSMYYVYDNKNDANKDDNTLARYIKE